MRKPDLSMIALITIGLLILLAVSLYPDKNKELNSVDEIEAESEPKILELETELELQPVNYNSMDIEIKKIQYLGHAYSGKILLEKPSSQDRMFDIVIQDSAHSITTNHVILANQTNASFIHVPNETGRIWISIIENSIELDNITVLVLSHP